MKEEISLPKLRIGSDYYATNEEDPLLASTSSSFKKKKGGMGSAGQKRTRMKPLALTDNAEEDIVAALEGSSAASSGLKHLATKKARQDALSA